jgi:molybdopterin biosynthesis enzyme MoaB
MATANSSASKEVVTAALLVMVIDLKEVRVVGDEETAIVHALNSLRHCCTYVFTTGGIGPTHDDITADCVAKGRWRRDERGAPAHDAHPQGRGSHP